MLITKIKAMKRKYRVCRNKKEKNKKVKNKNVAKKEKNK